MPSEARHPRDGAEHNVRSARPSLLESWGILDRDQHLAAVAAALLFTTMLLPWYQQNAVVSAAKSQPLVSRNLNAFAVFTFVEAAVLLVAIAVLVLLYARAAGRAFELPGGDGAVIFAGGIWAALLLVLRLFDKPGITHNGVAANVGIQWGIFFALAAAGLLAYAGSRMRAARRPEPPLLRHEPRARRAARHGERPRRPESGEERTEVVGRGELRPGELERDAAWDEPPEPREAATEIVARREHRPAAAPVSARERAPRGGTAESAPPPAPSAPAPTPERPRYPPAPAHARPRKATPQAMDQLSFDDTEPTRKPKA